MKIGFTGTRQGMTKVQEITLNALMPQRAEFHHGDCIGADAQAHLIAQRHQCIIHIYPPLHQNKRAFSRNAFIVHNPTHYLSRNREIVRVSDWLIAAPFEATEQLRSGTWSTVRFAVGGHKRVTVILPNGQMVER